jgi:hypothetical protein
MENKMLKQAENYKNELKQKDIEIQGFQKEINSILLRLN